MRNLLKCAESCFTLFILHQGDHTWSPRLYTSMDTPPRPGLPSVAANSINWAGDVDEGEQFGKWPADVVDLQSGCIDEFQGPDTIDAGGIHVIIE